MDKPDTMLKIRTLGRFYIYVGGKLFNTEWPSETVQHFFCSLLSPVDLYITWDRLCRSTLEIPGTRTTRRRLEEFYIRPLNSFLIKELGFTPLITSDEGIRINQSRINLDAFNFYRTVLDGLKLLSLGSQQAAFMKFDLAKTLYSGSYLPGMPGKIIANTRKELESIYLIANKGVIDEV